MAVVIVFIPFFIIALSVIRMVRYYNKERKYYKVKAEVIRNDVKYISSDNPMIKYTYYSPVLKFIDNEGEIRIFTSGEDNPDRQLYNVGSIVTLLVNPVDSSRFIFYDAFNGYVISIIWLIIGLSILFCLFYFL